MAGTSLAQSEPAGQIIGRSHHPNGAVVTGAAISVKSVETGAQRTATTNEDGVYTITNLQPGVYEITTEAANFAKSMQRLQVTVGAKAFPLETALSFRSQYGDS
jgi:protocatechuate 3,4-dioxygenase beta subunit